MRTIISIALALAVATPVLAQDFRASNHMRVNAGANGTFVVSGVPNFGPQDYWCAAGEYAQRVLRLSPNDRIYIVGDYQRGQRSYTFSPSPKGTASEFERVRGSAIRKDGSNLKTNAARAECYNRWYPSN
jgi:hypothetical protein